MRFGLLSRSSNDGLRHFGHTSPVAGASRSSSSATRFSRAAYRSGNALTRFHGKRSRSSRSSLRFMLENQALAAPSSRRGTDGDFRRVSDAAEHELQHFRIKILKEVIR